MTSPVIPNSFSTERADLYSALSALIAAFIAAVPDVIRKQWAAFPQTLAGEAPFVYIALDESIAHDMQTRTTTFTGFVGYSDPSPDPQESAGRVNIFADYMRDLFTANARLVPNTTLQQTGFVDGERLAGGAYATDPHVTFSHIVQVGRE